jgi:hypothetical protein
MKDLHQKKSKLSTFRNKNIHHHSRSLCISTRRVKFLVNYLLFPKITTTFVTAVKFTAVIKIETL